MIIKTSELTGAALDWAVAKCEGGENLHFDGVCTWFIHVHGEDKALRSGWSCSYSPSTDWAQGGEIIEREKIDLMNDGDAWVACMNNDSRAYDLEIPLLSFAALTPLVAAMRCYVASQLGDEVDVPEELL